MVVIFIGIIVVSLAISRFILQINITERYHFIGIRQRFSTKVDTVLRLRANQLAEWQFRFHIEDEANLEMSLQ